MRTSVNRLRTGRGMTLVELMLALVVVAILSVAVVTLLQGASNTDAYVRNQTSADSQVELAIRRMTHNLRAASALTSPTDTNTYNSFTIKTQNDPVSPETVSYTLTNGQLWENDTRYGNNPIVDNVAAFTVKLNSTTSPKTVTVTITAGKTGCVATRSFTVYCRNL